MEPGNFVVVTEGFVNVSISCSLSNLRSEKKFAKDQTILELKGKLEMITGGSCGDMKIEVYDDSTRSDGVKVCELVNDNALLGSYPVDSGMRLHVVDTSGRNQSLFDENQKVDKYELTPEQYAARQDTVKSFLLKNKLGKYNEEEMKRIEAEKAAAEAAELELLKEIEVGKRCEVTIPGNMARRGQVKYIGEVHFKPGRWIGVQYDEPLGKHDGTVDGKHYFECPNKYGSFVRVNHVKVGDFPEEEINFSDDEM